MPAFIANALHIKFQKEHIDRSSGKATDPPENILSRAVNSFLTRLRYVTRGQQVHELPWDQTVWHIQYLQDDGSEFEEQEGFARGRFVRRITLSCVAVNPDVWGQVHSLPPDFKTPPWDGLRLDAVAALPNIGTAVVLAATCLEVFIANILDALASRSSVPNVLWDWLNKRKERLKNPSVEEQFDSLLKFFTQHSLKEDSALWGAFMNLKTARNTFVHEGLAKVGGKTISGNDASKFVASAGQIIDRIRDWLPEEIRWPIFEQKVEMKMW